MIKNHRFDDVLDAREYVLYAQKGIFDDVYIHLTQRELRIIIRSSRNPYIVKKLKEFINRVDAYEHKKTDWNKPVPRTTRIVL